jgi:hypothetical protein
MKQTPLGSEIIMDITSMALRVRCKMSEETKECEAHKAAAIRYFVLIVEESKLVPKFWHRIQAFDSCDDGQTSPS